jgi:transcriptional regulator with XRE-family HTH domain
MNVRRGGPGLGGTDGAPATVPPGGELGPRPLSAEELGHRIKMLRVARGLTLKELEDRGGISATHVSEIERGKASPTVGALGRIAHALDLSPSSLVEPSALPRLTVLRGGEPNPRVVNWGRARLELLTEPVLGGELGAHIMTLPIGRDPALVHHHEGEEWVMVLSGVAEIRVHDHPRALREGDSLQFRGHHPHAYANLVSTPCVLLVVNRPRLVL